MNNTAIFASVKCLSRILFLIIFIVCLVRCNSNKTGNVDSESLDGKATEKNISSNGFPKFEFTKELHKFGDVSEGEIVVCDFFFKNIGSKDLVIKNVETSCGCTAVKWEKKPLGVGKESRIIVEFNTEGRYGKQYKVITIFSNTLTGIDELVISAQVK
ncbi:hypothetical protein BZG02_13240 [Labilibaculum filiforme]|uniref:DUF1573 domain-containing protein n=1 Tax=Labilibaculum filiforme TaxID=1940526 RepID=A0A2N3HW82_9BACT|nr:DUF1573 domain-containing protein [Labilibaculum filiforme]PKQ62335.1 hypothetical protein BZG02_13240 [Labilibaculum filiforme]